MVNDDFEEYLRSNLPKARSFHPHYEQALGEMLLAGGKRFRPALTLSVASGIDPQARKRAFPVALAIETMHTYSLIHDDLPAMDNADFRRSHPTLHKTYDEATAILVADALNTHAFLILSQAEQIDAPIKVKLIETLAKSAGADGMALGQALDCYFEGVRLSADKLEFIHLRKTAMLIAASLEMGALVAGANDDLLKALHAIGLDLGVFFQIRDDIIDATQDSNSAGKPTHSDGLKNSYVNLLGLEESRARQESFAGRIKAAIAALDLPLQTSLNEALKAYL
ncbi:MAG: polyprenyl synthetase family protein [Helicobacteraceae bacterium]|nr:polyprenyl synthetase family protein [Helicobacteraceae bacterium]